MITNRSGNKNRNRTWNTKRKEKGVATWVYFFIIMVKPIEGNLRNLINYFINFVYSKQIS